MKEGYGVEKGTCPSSDDESPAPLLNHVASEKNAADQARTKEDRSLNVLATHRERSKKRRFLFNKCLLYQLVFVGLVLTVLVRLWGAQHAPTPKNHETEQSKPTKALPNSLNFPALYPKLTPETSSECHAAWSELESVPCHDRVLFKSSDIISWSDYMWKPRNFLPLVCTDNCRTALEQARDLLSSKCSAHDRFVVDDLPRNFSVTFLRPRPAEVMDILVKRTNHLCRSDPGGDSDYEHCPTEMTERFWVIDDMGADVMLNLPSFLSTTATWYVEPEHWETGRNGALEAVDDDQRPYKIKEESYGPGEGQTSCSWCVFDYLSRTLNSWAEGAIISPVDGEPVSLPEFIRYVRIAGQRCSPNDQWQKIYTDALQRYHDSALLSPDWDAPRILSAEDYMIYNGPSKDDPPLSDINAEIQHLQTMEMEDASSLQSSLTCLEHLELIYSRANTYINLSQEKLISMMGEEPEAKELRKAYCNSICSSYLDRGEPVGCHFYNASRKTRQLLEQFSAATNQREVYCRLLNWNNEKAHCGQALLNMRKTSWALEERPDSPTLVKDVSRALEKLKSELVPDDLRDKFDEDPSVLSGNGKVSDRREKLSESVCTSCVWTLIRGFSLNQRMHYIKEAGSAIDYLEFVKMYHRTCTGLGATWLGDVPYGDDAVIWRVKRGDGSIARCTRAEPIPGRGASYCVNEATGTVDMIPFKEFSRWETKTESLWHVLEAERAVQALSEGRFYEWQSEEKKHREETDAKIWKVDTSTAWFAKVSYTGPVPLVQDG